MTEAQIEEAIERINCGHWGSEHIQTLIDLARSYLSAIKAGVPEEMKIPKGGFYGVNSCCEYREIDVWNACRSQMLLLLLAKDREIAELEVALKEGIHKICERDNELEALSARVRDVEGITDVLTSVYLPTDEVMTADGRKQKCLLTTYARMFATAISAWLQEGK